MPATLTYPGVYIEEIPSGVRTIVGVATSITAFLGRTQRGPANDPTTINSFGDFERQFGGLSSEYPLSYAVRDFYLNGGQQAIVVRVYKQPAQNNDGKARFAVADDVKLVAASAGDWGKKLRATIDVEVSDDARQRLNVTANDVLFNLIVRDSNPGGRTEKIMNLTLLKDSARRVDRVLAAESSLLNWDGAFPGNAPAATKIKDAYTKYLDLQAKLKGGNANEIKTAQDAYDQSKALLVDAATSAEKDLADAVKKNDANAKAAAETALANAEKATNAANSGALTKTDFIGSPGDQSGLYALDKADLFNLLCIPPDVRDQDTDKGVYQEAMTYCAARRAMLIVDSPAAWGANREQAASKARSGLTDLGLTGEAARNAALFFPRVKESDPNRDGQVDTFVPCGVIAGVMARTDVNRGVWKAPAGLDATINGIQELQVNLNDQENGMLNPLAINCLRAFPITGRVVWGARTLRGADQLADEYKYIPVRRLALYLEESLYRGLKWVVFEPNDEPLWAQIRLNVGAFMQNLFRQGAFQGKTPSEAYFVKCDKETTSQNDINLGIV
ncbi:MAG TPA: phage tail sheath subtilisin-like domain-containing protein, partial [Pyrinomonadaceae bacterium]|nr:phage tail sheath subtilisin-like domain-containing protein [Pyrinomonadaceae bacterium]